LNHLSFRQAGRPAGDEKPWHWDFITAQNAMLCAAKNALHKLASDGHDLT